MAFYESSIEVVSFMVLHNNFCVLCGKEGKLLCGVALKSRILLQIKIVTKVHCIMEIAIMNFFTWILL